jgi:putative transposase
MAVFSIPFEPAMVEEMLLERGIVVSYEPIRRWGRKFGAVYAKQLRRKKPLRMDIWHLDEVVISIGGQKHGPGVPLTRTVTFSTRSFRSAVIPKLRGSLLVSLLKRQGLAPKRIITDKLRSYGAAKREVLSAVEHRSH